MTQGFSSKPHLTFGILTTVAKDIFRSRYHAELLSGIFHRLGTLGHELKIFALPAKTGTSSSRERAGGKGPRPSRPYASLNEIFARHGLDGLLILTWRWIHPDIVRLVESTRDARVLVFNDPVPGLQVNNVYTDAAAGMAQAVGHLAKKGYRKIGMLHGPLAVPFRVGGKKVTVPFIDTRLKEKGFLRALKAKRIAFHRRWVRSGTANSEAEGYRVTRQWLREKKFPEAIVCGNDDLAFGALAALQETKRKAAVIGFDDNERAKSFTPPLTTIRQPLVRMAQDAVDILVKQCRTSRSNAVSRRYLPKLIVRKTA